MTEHEIITTLYAWRTKRSRKSLFFPNVYLHSEYIESDLIEISATGRVTEYEIKTSLADLLKEYDKKRWRLDIENRIKQYYFVLPGELYASYREKIDQFVRPDHGIITLHHEYHRHVFNYRRQARQNRRAPPVNARVIDRLYRKIYFRYWGLR